MVTAYMEDDETVPLYADFASIDAHYQSSINGIDDLFERYAQHGKLRPHGVTEKQLHHAHYNPDIYEFIKGDVRAFCFIVEGGLVVMTNAGIKHGQKASSKDVNKAIKVFNQYTQDKNNNNIEFTEADDESE